MPFYGEEATEDDTRRSKAKKRTRKLFTRGKSYATTYPMKSRDEQASFRVMVVKYSRGRYRRRD